MGEFYLFKGENNRFMGAILPFKGERMKLRAKSKLYGRTFMSMSALASVWEKKCPKGEFTGSFLFPHQKG